MKILLLHASAPENATLAYQRGWTRAVLADPHFETVAVNLADHSAPGRLRKALALRRRGIDAVVLLHSVFSNENYLLGRTLEAVAALDVPKAWFVGNEYKLMPEKMALAEQIGLDLLVTQLYGAPAQDLYRRRLGCRVVFVPSAGLDTDVFRPVVPRSERPIDLGYRSFDSPTYLGHRERREIAERFLEAGPRLGLTLDVSLDPADRLDETGWAAFLNRCRGQLGTEAGGDYFELTDETRFAVDRFEREHPAATWAEVHARFFRDYANPVSGRALSGRIVEAAGTKTVQVLLSGDYGGFFRADEHYIPLSPDFSDLDAAVEKFRDEAYAEELVERAFAVATTELTYERLLERFRAALAEVA